MKKLQEIDLLVEEALKELQSADVKIEVRKILNKLARKCAEINEEDFDYYSRKILYYNSRLRDGQVEEVEQEEVKEQTKPPSSKYYPLFKYFLDEHNVMLLETDCQEIERLLNSQPREWWMDLKKGDKFVFENNKVKEFNGFVELGDHIWLGSIEKSGISYRADYCSPYTDPAQSFREKLTPEMQVEFDKLMEGK